MAFIAAAVIGGGVALAGASMASRAAGKASDASAAASKAQLNFEKKKYEQFRETYGDIETNLSEYYSSLTPEFYEARGLETFQKEQQFALENVRSSLAQRGIEDSGVAIATEMGFAQEGAVQRSQIRANAPSLAAEEQRSFLQVGLGQNPGSSYSRALADRSANAGATAASANAAAGQAIGSAITTIGTGLADYANRPATPPPTTLPATQLV